MKNGAAAEEVVQETWLAVLTGLRTFEGRSALKTWIFNILVKRARTKWAREARSVSFSTIDGDGEAAVDPSRFDAKGTWSAPPRSWDDATPEKLLLDQEARARIERAIAGLPSQQRLVITLRDVEGLDSSEVCNVLDVTETNQRVLLHRARSKVRSELEQYLAGEERSC